MHNLIFAYMQKQVVFIAAMAALVLFSACPYNSIHSAGEEKKALKVKGITGSWITKYPGLASMRITTIQGRKNVYKLLLPQNSIYDNKSKAPLDTNYTLHINKINNHLIASIRKPTPDDNFYFLKVEMKGADTLITYEVNGNKFGKTIYTYAVDFRKALAAKLTEKDIFTDRKVWVRSK